MIKVHYFIFCISIFLITMLSCSTPGPAGLFGKKSLHEEYGDNITKAGLKETALGKLWFEAAARSLNQPLSITLPYSETGYFAAEKPSATGLRFAGQRGQVVKITLTRKPVARFAVYLDLWQPDENAANQSKLLLSGDSSATLLNYEVKQNGNYILRLQPELLRSGEYTLTITTAPSLVFPVSTRTQSRIASFWGANRDAGGRKHEGIDIMVPFRTPLVAAADGTIRGVNENNLGGKVVWLAPYGKDYTLYYAHLDEQLVSPGQFVKAGDTLGLAGTTGNAKGGPPHLHFGIYTNTGAVDPIAFVNPVVNAPEKITASAAYVGKHVRTNDKAGRIYGAPHNTPSDFIPTEAGALLYVEAASANWYKVSAPNGPTGYIKSVTVSSLEKPLRKYSIASSCYLFNAPDTSAARKMNLPGGYPINVLAVWKDYYFVQAGNQDGWILKTIP